MDKFEKKFHVASFMALFNGELSETAQMPKSRVLIKTVMVQKRDLAGEEFSGIANVLDRTLRT